MALALDEAREKRATLITELRGLRAAIDSGRASDGQLERADNLGAGVERLDREIADIEERLDHVRRQAADPRNHDGPQPGDSPRRRTDYLGETRTAALRTVERHADLLSAEAGVRLDDLIHRDAFELDSRYIEAVGTDAYQRAWAKKVLGAGGAEEVLEADEVEAMQKVGRAQSMRAMALGEGKTGGFGVPLALDPTILLISDGATNPIRQLASVSTINTHTWEGVSSKGVAFTFLAENKESEDASPADLAQPTISVEMASCWIPYAIPVGEDYGASGLAAEIARLLADAKDVKEAEIFATGKGAENIPQGLLVGATKTVTTAGSKVVAEADIYSLQQELPARWQPRATWLGSNTIANLIYRMVGAGDPESPRLMNEARDSILGKPYREVSTMSAKPTTEGELVLAYGSIRDAFKICDRVGMSVEPVQNVLSGGKPLGQRGIYAFFRVGSKTIIPEAVRVLKVKA
jgi:HK97 family phage major capsid protein